ncbi:MAG: DNA polymerase Y family protein [Deltaproteobacteria bacterium]|nr:DNA polymerase Y family protein [Deltaproteobacteria bacterium]
MTADRCLVAHLPGFRLERCGYASQEPVALVGERKSALRVLAATPAAVRCGIAPGMTLAQARALLPTLAHELHDPVAERLDLAELSQRLHRISPAVEPLPPDALAAGLRPGLEAVEREIIRRVQDDLARLGHRAHVVVADDLFGARVLAAWGRCDRAVPPGGLGAALAPLPVAALEPSPRVATLLGGLGIRTIGAFAALPPASVAGRLGPEGTRMHRLARGDTRRLPPASAGDPGTLTVAHELPFPVDALEPLYFVIHGLCRDLCALLESRGQGVLHLGLTLALEDAEPHRFEIRTGRPMCDPDRMARLIRRRLEGARLPSSVVTVSLDAVESAPWSGIQAGLLDRSGAAEPLPALVARLVEGLGPTAVLRAVARDTWRPEAAWAAVPLAAGDPFPVLESDSRVDPSPHKEGTPEEDPVWPHEAWRLDLDAPRPALLLAEPRPVEAEPSSGPPRRVRIEGRWCEVAAVIAQERLSGEWWADPIDRDCWILDLADGRRVWIGRAWGHALLYGAFDQGP